MSDKAPPTARRAGLARHLALDDNPLRRRTDRLEAWSALGQMHQHHGRGLGVHAGEEVRDARVRVPLRGRSGVKEGV